MPSYLDHLKDVALSDAEGLTEAYKHYGDSCLKRGGVGLYMMLARKIDRLELSVKQFGWNIFNAIRFDSRAEGIIDDIRDLRRYLMIVEAEARAQGLYAALTTSRDNKKPALFVPNGLSEDKVREIILNYRDLEWELGEDYWSKLAEQTGVRRLDAKLTIMGNITLGGEPLLRDSREIAEEACENPFGPAVGIRQKTNPPPLDDLEYASKDLREDIVKKALTGEDDNGSWEKGKDPYTSLASHFNVTRKFAKAVVGDSGYGYIQGLRTGDFFFVPQGSVGKAIAADEDSIEKVRKPNITDNPRGFESEQDM